MKQSSSFGWPLKEAFDTRDVLAPDGDLGVILSVGTLLFVLPLIFDTQDR